MSNITKNTNAAVLIGTDENYGAATAGGAKDLATSPGSLTSGAIGLYNMNGALITHGGGVTQFEGVDKCYFAQGTASNGPILGPVLSRSAISSQTYEDYSAPVRQYTLADISKESSPASTDEYGVKLIDTTPGTVPLNIWNASYYGIPDTDLVLLSDIADQFEANEDVIAYVSLTATLTSASNMDNNTTVTKGSKIITVATDLDYGNSAGTLAVGDWLNITGADGHTRSYEVDAISGLEVTLSWAYAADSETITAGAQVTRTTEANTAADSIGFTAKEEGTHFRLALYEQAEGDTITYTTTFDPGVGSSAVISTWEQDVKGRAGYYNRIMYPQIPTFYTVDGATYDVYSLVAYSVSNAKDVRGRIADPINVICAFPAGWGGESNFKAVVDRMANAYISTGEAVETVS